MKLQKFQIDTVKELKALFKENKIVCLNFYTGSGKTNIFLKLCEEFLKEKEMKIGISCYLTTEVKIQTADRSSLFDLDGDVSSVNSLALDGNKSVFVFNPQTIYKRDALFKFDLLIIDECHAGLLEGRRMLNSIIKTYCHKNTKILLVSATPWDILAEERFKNIPVLSRSMDEGVIDGRLSDVTIYGEENNLKFELKDFTRAGSLRTEVLESKHSLIKSVSEGKVKSIIARYDKEIGNKVLVICPPGNNGEIARDFAKEFNGLFLIENSENTALNSKGNLERFKNEKKQRFLFVINKCQVGFDMPELDSVIDLTMSRNIKLFVQRLGRVARKHGEKPKKYFYVYDSSLKNTQLEWLFGTAIDFSCGNHIGWTSKNVKYRPLKVDEKFRFRPPSIKISEISKAVSKKGAVENVITLRYVEGNPPKKRTLDEARREANQYSDKHDLFKKNPSLYKWFRVNGLMLELNKIHPPMVKSWDEKRVTEALTSRQFRSRTEFKKEFGGAQAWIHVNKRFDLFEKYLPAPPTKKYLNEEKALEILKNLKRWQSLRAHHGALRSWMFRQGKTQYYKEIWRAMHPKPPIVTEAPPPKKDIELKIEKAIEEVKKKHKQHKPMPLLKKEKTAYPEEITIQKKYKGRVVKMRIMK